MFFIRISPLICEDGGSGDKIPFRPESVSESPLEWNKGSWSRWSLSAPRAFTADRLRLVVLAASAPFVKTRAPSGHQNVSRSAGSPPTTTTTHSQRDQSVITVCYGDMSSGLVRPCHQDQLFQSVCTKKCSILSVDFCLFACN